MAQSTRLRQGWEQNPTEANQGIAAKSLATTYSILLQLPEDAEVLNHFRIACITGWIVRIVHLGNERFDKGVEASAATCNKNVANCCASN